VDLVVLSLFAAIGIVFMAYGFQPIPLLLGFILGPLAEENLRRAMMIANGDPTVFVTRPVSAVLVAIISVLLLLLVLPAFRKTREEFGD
jgi:TctA family transporter